MQAVERLLYILVPADLPGIFKQRVLHASGRTETPQRHADLRVARVRVVYLAQAAAQVGVQRLFRAGGLGEGGVGALPAVALVPEPYRDAPAGQFMAPHLEHRVLGMAQQVGPESAGVRLPAEAAGARDRFGRVMFVVHGRDALAEQFALHVAPRASEERNEQVRGAHRDVPGRLPAVRRHVGLPPPPDAGDGRSGPVPQELLDPHRQWTGHAHGRDAGGLPVLSRHLGEQLARSHAYGDREARLIEDRLLDGSSPDIRIGGDAADNRPEIQVPLIDRHLFHDWTMLPDDTLDLLGGQARLVEVRGHADGIWTQAHRFLEWRARADALGFRFVAGRDHEPAAHAEGQEGFAAQARVLPDKNGREKRIRVDVRDHGLA